jgi:sRNA-binding regulator protein Hfq
MSKRITPKLPAQAELSDRVTASPSTITSATAVLEPPSIAEVPRTPVRKSRIAAPTIGAKRFSALPHDDHATNHQAELFYLQKQIQLQTPMVFVLEDGARIQGVVEWYDRNSIKIRGKSRVLVYKSAIKYLYKAGEVGSAPEA